MELPPELAWSAVRGSLDPILGWYSPSYGAKLPTWVLVGEGVAAPGTAWNTRIRFVAQPSRGWQRKVMDLEERVR